MINIHHYDGFLVECHEKNEALKAVERIWTQIAEHYRDYSDYLVFEGFNESMGNSKEGYAEDSDEIYSYINEMNQMFVDAVRKTGGNNEKRMLIASGYWTNIDKTTNHRFKMPNDSTQDRLMVSVHYINNYPFWANAIGTQWWLDYSK